MTRATLSVAGYLKKEHQFFSTLGKVVLSESNVPASFTIMHNNLEKWQILTGHWTIKFAPHKGVGLRWGEGLWLCCHKGGDKGLGLCWDKGLGLCWGKRGWGYIVVKGWGKSTWGWGYVGVRGEGLGLCWDKGVGLCCGKGWGKG